MDYQKKSMATERFVVSSLCFVPLASSLCVVCSLESSFAQLLLLCRHGIGDRFEESRYLF